MSFAAKAAAFRKVRRQTLRTERLREEETRKARLAILRAEREKRKAEDQARKDRNRWARAEKTRRKKLPGSAECCLNWYPRGCGWTQCHTCGKALVFTNESPCR